MVAWVVAFLCLFAAYQAPEGIGQRLLGRFDVQAGLLIAFFGVAWLVARGLGRSFSRAYGLERRAGVFTLTLVLFAVALLAKRMAAVAGIAAGVYVRDAPSVASQAALLPGLAAGLLTTFLPSIAEDLVTRGLWLRGPLARSGALTVIAVTTVVYVGNHVFRLALGPTEWGMLAAFGIAYGAAAVRADSLWAAVGLHWGWNYANVLESALWPASATSPNAGRLVSGLAHLTMAALAWWIIPRLRPARP